MNVLLVAEEGAGLQMLKTLERSEHRVAMVLTSPPEARSSAVWTYAEERGHRVLPAGTVKDASFASVVRDERIDLLLNVHSLYVVKGAILEAPRLGSFNLHPGPLPRYAGLNAPAWAIYRGERSHGVTIHHMLAGIDTGPIAYQTLFDLDETDTALSVGMKCVAEGLALMSALVEAAAADADAIPRLEQDASRREYFGREIPDGGVLAWDRPAREVGRFVRAFSYHPFPSPWGHPKTTLGGREVAVIKVSPTGRPASSTPGTVAASGSDVHVACADEWIRLDLIKVDGTRVEPCEALRDGDRLGPR